MKHCRLLFLFCLFMLITGCSPENRVIPVLNNIEFTANIDYFNENYSCNTTIDADSVVRFEVIEPQIIEGMILIFDDSTVTAEYKGIVYTPKTETMPVSGVAFTIYNILIDAKNDAETVFEKGKNCTVSGEVGNYKYTFTFSPSGLPISLVIPDESFKVTFENVKITNNNQSG